MCPIRVLLVDDYEPFRRMVRLTLAIRDDLEIVGEASDGLEAVKKAKNLQPDLILLDIDLPALNGMQVARRLRDLLPSVKVLFVSVDSSSDIVREALHLGQGYVYKLRVASELLTAVETVLRGERFLSGEFKGKGGEPKLAQAHSHRHEMLIYSDETVLLEAFTIFVGAALRAETPVIAAPTKSHLGTLLQKLTAEGLDVNSAIKRGSFIPLDAAEKLSTLIVNGLPDRFRWMNTMSSLVETVRRTNGNSRIALCGECTPILLAQGKTEGAIRLEQLSNSLMDTHEFDILCAFPSNSFRGEQSEDVFKTICAEHTAVYTR